MQVDAKRSGVVLNVAKGVLDLHLIPIWVGEEVIPHGLGCAAVDEHPRVLEANRGPALDGEADRRLSC